MTNETKPVPTSDQEKTMADQLTSLANSLSGQPTDAQKMTIFQTLYIIVTAGYKSKLVWLGFLLVVFSIIQAILPSFQEELKGWYWLILGAVGLIVMYLRGRTTLPLEKK